MESTPQKLLTGNFPLCFENGYIVKTLAFWCVKCGRVAHESQVLGQLSRIVPDTADIRASYHCGCGYTNSYRIRLKDDKSFSFLADGAWQERLPEKRSVVTELRERYRKIVEFCKFKWSCFWLMSSLKKLRRFVLNPPDDHS